MADPFQVYGNPTQNPYFGPYWPAQPEPQESQFSLPSYISGGTAGNGIRNSNLWLGIGQAEQAYNPTYNATINSWDPTSAGAVLFDAPRNAMNAVDSSLATSGIDINNTYGSYLSKAANFLVEKSQAPGPKVYIDPNVTIERARRGDSYGEYFVHVMKKNYMTNPSESKLANGKLAWLAPLEDIAGLKLDRETILRHFGFEQDAIARGAGDSYLLTIHRKSDLLKDATTTPVTPTWEYMTEKFRGASEFKDYRSAYGDSFFEDLRSIKYSDYKAARARDAGTGQSRAVDEFLTGMSKRDRDLYEGRFLGEKLFGPNEHFTGEGYTKDPQGLYATRESVIPNEALAKIPPHAVVELRDDNSPITIGKTVEGPPNRLVLTKDSAKGGAIGALSAVATGLYEDFTAYRADKLSAKEWIMKLPAEVAQNATLGFAGGAVENVVEKTTTQVIIEKIGLGKSLPGQALRQIPGALGAGAVISFGASTYEQVGALRRGDVTFPQATGNITSETLVGGTAGVVGLGAGAAASWISTKLLSKGAGLLVGGPVGFVAGVGAGYLFDNIVRANGWDKSIAEWTTRQVEGVQDFAVDTWEKTKIVGSYAWEGTKYYSSAAWEGTKSVASDSWDAIKGGASAAWDVTSSAAVGAWDWTTSWFE